MLLSPSYPGFFAVLDTSNGLSAATIFLD